GPGPGLPRARPGTPGILGGWGYRAVARVPAARNASNLTADHRPRRALAPGIVPSAPRSRPAAARSRPAAARGSNTGPQAPHTPQTGLVITPSQGRRAPGEAALPAAELVSRISPASAGRPAG